MCLSGKTYKSSFFFLILNLRQLETALIFSINHCANQLQWKQYLLHFTLLLFWAHLLKRSSQFPVAPVKVRLVSLFSTSNYLHFNYRHPVALGHRKLALKHFDFLSFLCNILQKNFLSVCCRCVVCVWTITRPSKNHLYNMCAGSASVRRVGCTGNTWHHMLQIRHGVYHWGKVTAARLV